MHDSDDKLLQTARELFQRGDLAGADRAVAQAAAGVRDGASRPIPDILLVKAFYLCRMGRAAEARQLFGRVLQLCPDDRYAQEGYLLALRDSLQPAAGNGTLLIGLGTGRSGSTTLTRLWGAQPGCYCSHEHPPRLAWSGSPERQDFHVRRFGLLLAGHAHVGDVSHWWLPRIDQLAATFPALRVVVLQRDREATIDSFLRIKGGPGRGAINHWSEHDGSYWQANAWDECYPRYPVQDMRAALEQYWDEYYRATAELEQRHPGTVRSWHTEALGELDTQRELLTFCGFTDPVLQEDIHYNRGSAVDGEHLY